MPVIKISLQEGKELDFLINLKNTIHEAVIQSLQIPADDKNILISEYKVGLFEMKAPYEFLIEIVLFDGRTKEMKKQLIQSITKNCFDKLTINPETIFIILNEINKENWGIRGGIPADEIYK